MKVEIMGWESSYTPPDRDGDAYVRGSVTFDVTGDETAHLVVARHSVVDAQGLPVIFEDQEQDDELDHGNTCQIEATTYAKGDYEGAIGRIFLELYAIEHRAVASTGLPAAEQRSGDAKPIALSDGLTLQGWSLSTSAPNEEGEVTVELLMVVRNDSEVAIPCIEARASLRKRNDDELDYCHDTLHGLLPNQTRKLSGSAWFQERWLSKNVSALITLRQHQLLATAQTPPTELELRAN